MAFGYPHETEKVNIDYSRCTPVAVIANFNADGRIMPAYVCIQDLYGNTFKTKVEGIKYTKDGNGYIMFCCLVKSGNRQQEISLSYYVDQHLWVLGK
jgi:hypothetical protein